MHLFISTQNGVDEERIASYHFCARDIEECEAVSENWGCLRLLSVI